MNLKTIDSLGDLKDKRVLLRVDLNVPVKEGKVTDMTRIRAFKPTVTRLKHEGAKIILMSHFGRPGGKADPKLSLKHIVPALEEVLGEKVSFAGDALDKGTADKIKRAKGILLLENLRFHNGEKNNDPAFAKKVASLGDVYVGDAFSMAHRSDASMVGVPKLLPAAAGLSLVKEIEHLEAVLTKPKRPVCAVVGGSKVSTKIGVLEHLLGKADHLIIGGGMANTFLAAEGKRVGASLCEHDLTDVAKKILKKAKDNGCTIHLPREVSVAKHIEPPHDYLALPIGAIEDDDIILDIGPKTIDDYNKVIRKCHTLLWNGPLGMFEVKPFDRGTTKVARYAGERTEKGKLVSVAGGGDTIAALAHAHAKGKFSYVSIAGGAFLEWLEGKTLPGIQALVL